MSDYVHNKEIWYPIDNGDLDVPGFETIYTYEGTYLAKHLYGSYGEECGDFGRSRFLSEKEQAKYKPIFEVAIGPIDASKLKYIDYCYYNCCEPDDFYSKEDDFYKEI